MVLGLDRQPLVGRIERRAARHRPALQHIADLQAKIVMVSGSVMLVHDEAIAFCGNQPAGGLRRLAEFALGAIGLEFGGSWHVKDRSARQSATSVSFLRAPLCPALFAKTWHLPHTGGDRMSRPLSPISDVAKRAPTVTLPISPLVGEMSGRTEGGAVPPASKFHRSGVHRSRQSLRDVASLLLRPWMTKGWMSRAQSSVAGVSSSSAGDRPCWSWLSRNSSTQ